MPVHVFLLPRRTAQRPEGAFETEIQNSCICKNLIQDTEP